MGQVLRRLPMLWLLMPLLAIILCSRYWNRPFHLLQDTEVDFLDTTRSFRVVVEDYAVERRKTWRYEVNVLPSGAHAYLYIQKDSLKQMPQMGDTLGIYTTFRRGGRLGKFDYGTYLRLQGIMGSGYVRSEQWQIVAPHQPTWSDKWNARRWQRAAYRRYQELGITGEELGTLAALTLGYKEDLDSDLRQSFQRAGAAHILAVSGLHTGIVYGIVLWLITGFGLFPALYKQRRRQYLQFMGVVSIMVAYAALTGWSPSVVRSVVMVALVELARCWHRQPISMNTLIAAAFFILCFRPGDLFSVSFQLSFAAVAAIITLVPMLNQLFPTPPYHSWGRAAHYMRDLVTFSLAAQLGTLPIALHYFSQTSNYFLLTNLLVIPLTTLLVMGAIVVIIGGGIPVIGSILVMGEKGLCQVLNHSVRWVESLPHATTSATLPWAGVGCMYAILIAFTILLHYGTRETPQK